jgi:protein-tyrosine-phosphatase
MKNILIVSNDGLARGVMTYAALKKKLGGRQKNAANLKVAGLLVSRGTRPDPLALKALKAKGLSAQGFRVSPMNQKLLKEADTVIALSPENYNYLRHTYGPLTAPSRVLNVPPIIDRKPEKYEKCLDRIGRSLNE